VESPEHQRRGIEEYFLTQSPEGTEIIASEKVASERVFSRKHDVWDVHAADGSRWWVITNPTNLYPHNDNEVTPSMDRALAIHIGILVRLAHRDSKEAPVEEEEREVAPRSWRKYEQAAEALDKADEAEDFQTVGMRLREALLAFVQEAGTTEMVPSGETPPQRGNFKAWAALIAAHIAPGGHHERIRGYLRRLADETWELVNWLTHATNAYRYDGIIAIEATSYLLSAYSTAFLRHTRGVPDRCPDCGSYQLTVDYRGFDEEERELLEFNLCEACGWEEQIEQTP
jgi:hypothetical protein